MRAEKNIFLAIGRVNNGSCCSLFGLFVRLKIVILFYRGPDKLLSFRQMSLSFQRVWETLEKEMSWEETTQTRLSSLNKFAFTSFDFYTVALHVTPVMGD